MPRAILLLIVAAMIGCRTPQRSDLVGAWTVPDQVRQSLPSEVRKAAATLVLDADGTFEATELPEEVEPQISDPRPRIRFDSGSGTWVLQKMDGGQDIELEFHKLGFGDSSSSEPYGLPWSAWELNYYLGDPDDAPKVTLTRK